MWSLCTKLYKATHAYTIEAGDAIQCQTILHVELMWLVCTYLAIELTNLLMHIYTIEVRDGFPLY